MGTVCGVDRRCCGVVGAVGAGAVRSAVRVAVMMCECSDPQCPHCGGACDEIGRETLYRIDMEDHTGTRMCAVCSEDAMGSGLFMAWEDKRGIRT